MPSSSWLANVTYEVESRTYKSLVDQAISMAATFFGIDDDDPRLKNDPFTVNHNRFTGLYKATITVYLTDEHTAGPMPPAPVLPAHGSVAIGRFAPEATIRRTDDTMDWDALEPGDEEDDV